MSRTAPVLRALVEDGTTYDDPSEDALFMLFEDIEAGEGSWVSVALLEDASSQTFAQCLRLADGAYQVEYRAGAADRHYVSTVPGFREAHAFLTGWAFELPGWNDLPWSRLAT